MVIKLFDSEDQAAKAVPMGTSRKLVVKEKDFLLIHTSVGFVISDYLCPHLKEPLLKSKLNAFNELICPLHEYRFNLKTGSESANRCSFLTIYQIALKSDGLFLEI